MSLGDNFLVSYVLDIGELAEESRVDTPMICFLSMGSDPTLTIEKTARKDNKRLDSISMGQGKEILERKLLSQKLEIVKINSDNNKNKIVFLAVRYR